MATPRVMLTAWVCWSIGWVKLFAVQTFKLCKLCYLFNQYANSTITNSKLCQAFLRLHEYDLILHVFLPNFKWKSGFQTSLARFAVFAQLFAAFTQKSNYLRRNQPNQPNFKWKSCCRPVWHVFRHFRHLHFSGNNLKSNSTLSSYNNNPLSITPSP